jgi:uncharacterized protein involved in exopolysaccharide biosynthesis
MGRRRPGSPVDPYRVKRALLAGRFWLIGAAVGGLIVGLLYVKLLMGDNYETTVVLKYEGDVQIGDQRPSGHALGPAADALVRQSVLEKIREELGFEDTLTSLAAWIAYEPDPRAGTLYFTVSGETGEDAAEYARVVTEVFMTYHKERQARRFEDELARTRKRIAAALEQGEDARQLYNDFREAHGIADLSIEQRSMVESAAALRAQSELAGSEVRALEAQAKSLETQLASTSKTSFVSEGSSPERAAYDQLRQELASARATLSADHPRVQSLQQQVDYLRSQIRSGGSGRSAGGGLVGVNTTYQALEGQLRETKSSLGALRERQKGLSEMADKAQHRVEAFSDIEGEASALLADVEVNEGLASWLHETEASLQDALRDPPSGFVVLDPGAVPEYPVRNKMKIVFFLAIPTLLVALALLIVLRREFQGLRLQTPAEVAFWGNGPVLGATSWPNDPHGLDELVAGLDDFVPWATGDLLIIGASPADSRLSSELVERVRDDWLIGENVAASEGTPDTAPYEPPPLRTPPPSGPYPVGQTGTSSTALVLLPSKVPAEPMRLARRPERLRLEAWDGPFEGQALRRAARLADRVVVLVRSGVASALQLNGIRKRLGRDHGIGYIVVGIADELRTLPDRAGDVTAFWRR